MTLRLLALAFMASVSGCDSKVEMSGTPNALAVTDGSKSGKDSGTTDQELGALAKKNAITSAEISDGEIIDADISSSAAISGSKIIPDFGSQPITTTGVISGDGSGLKNVPVIGTAGGGAVHPSTGCPDGYIPVPGDSDYGTSDFCVMKYEAKFGMKGIESRVSGYPLRSQTFGASLAACQNAGPGYALINNAEWMTIATNLAKEASNWSGGAVGSGTLPQGHSDSSPTTHCPASSNDLAAWVESDCTPKVAGGGEDQEATQKRTMVLSNGNVIWDFSGNLWEVVDYASMGEDKPTGGPEFTAVVMPASLPSTFFIPNRAQKSWWDDTWTSAQGIGTYASYGSTSLTGVLIRGGFITSGTNAGPFAANLATQIHAQALQGGFRCVYRRVK